MNKNNRLDLANLGQQWGWSIDGLLTSARDWMRLSRDSTEPRECKTVAYMYLNRAMEIEAGITISGEEGAKP